MNMTQEFTNIRLQNQMYVKQISDFPLQKFLHREGWTDTSVGQELIFSHRDTLYTPDTFTEKFHTHEYYEIIFYIRGDVEYLNENTLINSAPCTIIWFKPGQMHTARLHSSSRYERYVLYLSPDFFSINDRITPITDFMGNSTGTHMTLSQREFGELIELLNKAEGLLQKGEPYGELVLKALLIQLFYILDSQETKIREGEAFTDAIGEVKKYIDANYASISSISEIADYFFYSREHLSRKFMQSFNISIAHYLSGRRVNASLELLEKMSVADAAYAVGFRSQSAYIKAFKNNMHCLPSEYKSRFK